MRSRSIRWRLTFFYGVVFMLAGAALLLISFLVVRETLVSSEVGADRLVVDAYGFNKEQVDFVRNIPVPEPPTGRDAANVGQVIEGVQQDIRTETLHSLVWFTGASLVGLVGISLLVGWVAAGRALRPVGQITARAQEISEESLHERLSLEGPNDELKELADTLDGMLTRLEDAFDAQRGFAANVSHELRTPLAVIQGEADLVLDDPGATTGERELAARVGSAAARAESLLESLLALARSESTMANHEAVDVVELAGDVVAERAEAADLAGIELELALGTGVVEGDRWLLERLIANLVDNGINYNRRGGWLSVEVDTFGHDVVLTVSNTGDQLTAAEVDDIVKPFRRAADRSRPGYGLGMAIATSIATAHGGALRVQARREGGLDVEVRLPTRDADDPSRALPDPRTSTQPSPRVRAPVAG